MNDNLDDLESASNAISANIKKPLKDIGFLLSVSFIFGFAFLFLQSWQLWVVTAFIVASLASGKLFLKSFPDKTIQFKTRKGLLALLLLIPITPLYMAPVGISVGIYQLLLLMLDGSFAFVEMLAVISGFTGSALWTYGVLYFMSDNKPLANKTKKAS
jgi:hypothetical protein